MRSGFTIAERLGLFARSAVLTIPSIKLGRCWRLFTGNRFATSVPAPATVQSVLIVALDHLGDLIVSEGYFRDVRVSFPEARIVLVVDKKFEQYASRCPYADLVLGFDQRGSKYYNAIAGPFRAFQFARRHLWGLRLDLALNHRWDVDALNGSLLGLFSNARVHAGFSSDSNARKRVINKWADGAYSHLLHSPKLIHEAERGHELLQFLGFPANDAICALWNVPKDWEFASRHLPNNEQGPAVALGVGASQRKRQWPMERFRSVAEQVLDRWPNARFVVVGNQEDGLIAEQLRHPVLGTRLYNFAGRCSVGESGALLSRCSLYLGNDSGPMHMAAALGVPVVQLSCHPLTGSRESAHAPDRYHPYGVPYIVLRPVDFENPCDYACTAEDAHCILAITVEQATAAAEQLLRYALDTSTQRTPVLQQAAHAEGPALLALDDQLGDRTQTTELITSPSNVRPPDGKYFPREFLRP